MDVLIETVKREWQVQELHIMLAAAKLLSSLQVLTS